MKFEFYGETSERFIKRKSFPFKLNYANADSMLLHYLQFHAFQLHSEFFFVFFFFHAIFHLENDDRNCVNISRSLAIFTLLCSFANVILPLIILIDYVKIYKCINEFIFRGYKFSLRAYNFTFASI